MRGCAHALRPHDVFMRERDPMQRSAIIARGDLAFGGVRPRERRITGHGDICMGLLVKRLDARKVRTREFDRGELAAADKCRRFTDREVMQIVCHAVHCSEGEADHSNPVAVHATRYHAAIWPPVREVGWQLPGMSSFCKGRR